MPTVSFGFVPPPTGWYEPWTVSTEVAGLVLTPPTGDWCLLVVCKPRPKDLTPQFQLGPYAPTGWPPHLLNWGWGGYNVTIYPAATEARSSASDDLPANWYIPDKISPSINFGTGLFSGTNPLDKSQTKGTGVIVFNDPDGELNNLFDYFWDGAQVEIHRGLRGTHFSTWPTVSRYTASYIAASRADGTLRLFLRDIGWKLNVPIHDEFYDGSGGINGEDINKNTPKPYTIGHAGGIAPRLINKALKVYQWSWTPSQAVLAVYHSGSLITVDATYPTYAALIAAVIPAGQCAVCLECSCVIFNVDIDGIVTVDVVGDANTSYGLPAPNNRSECILRIASSYSNNNLSLDTDVDLISFAFVSQNHPADVGWFYDSPPKKIDVINEMLEGILGWGYISALGRYSIGYARNINSVEEDVQDLAYGDEGMGLPEIVAVSAPRHSTSISYRRNYTVLTQEQLSGEVLIDEDAKARLTKEAQWSKSESDHVRIFYPSSEDVKINGGFWNAIDSDAESVRQQGFMENEQFRYSFPMEIDQFVNVLDRTFNLKNANTLNLGTSRKLLVVDVDTSSIGPTNLEWWST